MINHKLKCIFVEIPKTGSTSIRSIIGEPKAPHLTILQLQNQVTKQQFEEYFKFAFVRNPWDRELSLYKYITRKKNSWHPYHKRFCQFGNFSAFLKGMKQFPKDNSTRVRKATQLDFLTGSKGEVIVDFIGRFENLQEDFNFVCDKTGIPQQKLPHKNKTNHKHYTKYYDHETREIIAEKYSKEIEYFGYEFGE